MNLGYRQKYTLVYDLGTVRILDISVVRALESECLEHWCTRSKDAGSIPVSRYRCPLHFTMGDMEKLSKEEEGSLVNGRVEEERVEESVEERGVRGSKLPQYVAAIIVNLAAFTQGTIVGWPSPVMPALQSEEGPVFDQPMTDDEVSLMGALLCAGATIMTPVYSYLANNKSRKLTGYLIGIPPVICWLMTIYAKTKVVLYVARFFIGCVGAGNTVLCPIYVTEIAEDSVRGSLGTYVMLFFYVGVLFSYSIGGYTSYTTFSWICLFVPLLFMFAFFWLPESPFYLMVKNKPDQARKDLTWLRSGDSRLVEEEMSKITEAIQRSKHDRNKKPSIKDLFLDRGTRRAMVVSLGLVANNQLCGMFAVLTFTVTIFKDSGSDLSPNLASILVGVLQCLGIFVTAALIDRAGRRILQIISNIALAVCLGVLGLYSYYKIGGADVSSYGWVPVVCLCSYVVFIGLGVTIIPYIVMNEIFPPEMRGMALTINYVIMWVLAFVVTRYFIPVADVFGLDLCYGFFAFCCVLGALFAYYMLPETKNKSLETILREFRGDVETDIPLQEVVREKKGFSDVE
uniref:Major facilitator superfamily (MFS) profile domain-containing protein n=1 Tax=Timema genevievae TaxID=629358 RepID=A0A7R9JMJ8_TIMGE|nr:unnamed protein product [Timema genevievae]